MANTRSAEKQQRQAEKAKIRNRAGKTRLRSELKRAKLAIGAAKPEGLEEVLRQSFSAIDKAAKKSIIKENTANRYKSRLAAGVKRASA